MVGSDLLIAPPPFPDKLDFYDVKLPSHGWYDFWTGRLINDSATSPDLHIKPELAKLPVFVRPGSIIPTAPLVQSTGELPSGPLRLRVFPGPNCRGDLYQDDGATFAYRQDGFLRMSFSCEVSPTDQSLSIHVGEHTGNFPAWWRTITLEVYGLPYAPKSILVGGRSVVPQTSVTASLIDVPDDGHGVLIQIRP